MRCFRGKPDQLKFLGLVGQGRAGVPKCSGYPGGGNLGELQQWTKSHFILSILQERLGTTLQPPLTGVDPHLGTYAQRLRGVWSVGISSLSCGTGKDFCSLVQLGNRGQSALRFSSWKKNIQTKNSQNGRGWKGPLWVICRSRVTQSRLHRTASRRGLNISREGDSTTSLGSLCQGSVTLRVKKSFLMFRRNFLSFSFCPLLLVLSLGTTAYLCMYT